jgi:hypothetical protein
MRVEAKKELKIKNKNIVQGLLAQLACDDS